MRAGVVPGRHAFVQIRDQSGLPDPRLTDDRDEAASTIPVIAVEELSKQRSFALASDEGRCILVGGPDVFVRPDPTSHTRSGSALPFTPTASSSR